MKTVTVLLKEIEDADSAPKLADAVKELAAVGVAGGNGMRGGMVVGGVCAGDGDGSVINGAFDIFRRGGADVRGSPDAGGGGGAGDPVAGRGLRLDGGEAGDGIDA